jgi:hypothetical protein
MYAKPFLKLTAAVILLLSSLSLQAADVLKETTIGMDLARDIASETIMICRKDGYHISG